jgi:hypothetical protein
MVGFEKVGNKIIGAVWGIGERKFGHDFRRRVMMFDSLVKSVMMYGAEIWVGRGARKIFEMGAKSR